MTELPLNEKQMKLIFRFRAQGSTMLLGAALVILVVFTAGCATSWLEQSNQEIEAAQKSKDSSALGRALEKRAEQYALLAINPENGQSSTVSFGQSSEQDYRAAAKSFIDGSNPAAGLAALRKCVDLLLRAGFGEACDEALVQASALHEDKGREVATREAYVQRLTIRRANRTAFIRSVNQSAAQQEAKREQEKADSERRQRLAAAMLSGIVAATSSQQPTQGTGQTARGITSTPSAIASGQSAPRSSAQTSTYTPQISSAAASSNRSQPTTEPKYRSQSVNQCLRLVPRSASVPCGGAICLQNVCSITVYASWRKNDLTFWSGSRIGPGNATAVSQDRNGNDRFTWTACSVDSSSGALNPSRDCVYRN